MSAGDLGMDIAISFLKGCFFVCIALTASMALFGWIASKIFPTAPFPLLLIIGAAVTMGLAAIVGKIVNR